MISVFCPANRQKKIVAESWSASLQELPPGLTSVLQQIYFLKKRHGRRFPLTRTGLLVALLFACLSAVAVLTTGCSSRTAEIDLGGATTMKFVLIRAGTFTMGSPAEEPGRWSGDFFPHQVTLTQNFYMGATEVTQGQYQRVMRATPSYFGPASNLPNTEAHPVEQVTWFDAARFCNALSVREGLTPCYSVPGRGNDIVDGDNVACSWTANGYRLPTEAEWEYACRAGTSSMFSWAATQDDEQMKNHCWFAKNAFSTSWTMPHAAQSGTQPVATKLPNAWGLYDMSGNVWEWCNDWWEDPGARPAQTDPRGPATGVNRVGRGGSWAFKWSDCRSGYRSWSSPGYRWYSLGFRVVRSDF